MNAAGDQIGRGRNLSNRPMPPEARTGPQDSTGAGLATLKDALRSAAGELNSPEQRSGTVIGDDAAPVCSVFAPQRLVRRREQQERERRSLLWWKRVVATSRRVRIKPGRNHHQGAGSPAVLNRPAPSSAIQPGGSTAGDFARRRARRRVAAFPGTPVAAVRLDVLPVDSSGDGEHREALAADGRLKAAKNRYRGGLQPEEARPGRPASKLVVGIACGAHMVRSRSKMSRHLAACSSRVARC